MSGCAARLDQAIEAQKAATPLRRDELPHKDVLSPRSRTPGAYARIELVALVSDERILAVTLDHPRSIPRGDKVPVPKGDLHRCSASSCRALAVNVESSQRSRMSRCTA